MDLFPTFLGPLCPCPPYPWVREVACLKGVGWGGGGEVKMALKKKTWSQTLCRTQDGWNKTGKMCKCIWPQQWQQLKPVFLKVQQRQRQADHALTGNSSTPSSTHIPTTHTNTLFQFSWGGQERQRKADQWWRYVSGNTGCAGTCLLHMNSSSLANYETTAPISESGNPGGGQVSHTTHLDKQPDYSGACHYW